MHQILKRCATRHPCFAFSILLVSVIIMTAIGTTIFTDQGSIIEVSGETSGTCGEDLTWTFDNGSLTITGSGAMTDFSSGTTKWGGNTIETVNISYGVTSIGNCAFENCKDLKLIAMPNSVTSIGDDAFIGCIGLTSIGIPSEVTDIGVAAFSGCIGVTSIYIPDRVTSLGAYAFIGCSGLTSITIGNSVANIGEDTFSGCSGLTSVTFGKSITDIGEYAFSGCSGLTSITIGDSVRSVGKGAFNECNGLTSVTFGKSIKEIGGNAFYRCIGLTSVYIPDGLTDIGDGAFSQCTKLASIYIPDGVTTIGKFAFDYSGLTSIDIPDSVTSIGQGAFYYCTGLTSAVIGNSVMTIGKSAFACPNLGKITFGQSLTSMDGAFPYHTFFAEDGTTALNQSDLSGFRGHTFKGEVGKMIRTDSTTISQHHVIYNLNGGSGNAPTQADVQVGQKFTVASYSGTNGTLSFGGWSYNGATYKAGDEITMGSKDITLTAIWNPKKDIVPDDSSKGDDTTPVSTHHVIYYLNGGSGNTPTQADVQVGKTFRAASYSGTNGTLSFGGWSYNGTTYQAGDEITMGSKDITLTAIWISEEEPVPDKTSDVKTQESYLIYIAIGIVILITVVGVAVLLKHR